MTQFIDMSPEKLLAAEENHGLGEGRDCSPANARDDIIVRTPLRRIPAIENLADFEKLAEDREIAKSSTNIVFWKTSDRDIMFKRRQEEELHRDTYTLKLMKNAAVDAITSPRLRWLENPINPLLFCERPSPTPEKISSDEGADGSNKISIISTLKLRPAGTILPEIAGYSSCDGEKISGCDGSSRWNGMQTKEFLMHSTSDIEARSLRNLHRNRSISLGLSSLRKKKSCTGPDEESAIKSSEQLSVFSWNLRECLQISENDNGTGKSISRGSIESRQGSAVWFGSSSGLSDEADEHVRQTRDSHPWLETFLPAQEGIKSLRSNATAPQLRTPRTHSL
jgi:hypothetical protein